MKILLIVSLFVFSLFASAGEVRMFVEGENSMEELRIEVRDGNLCVDGAEGLVAEIYDVVGNPVASYKIDSDSKTISLSLKKGFYMIRVGKKVRKIYFS